MNTTIFVIVSFMRGKENRVIFKTIRAISE